MSKPGYKQTKVGLIPEDWEVRTLENVFDFSGGFTASRDQLSSEGHCYLHYGDIHKSSKSFIDVRDEYDVIPKLNISLKRIAPKSLLCDGDVVFVDASEDEEGTGKYIVVANSENIPFISGLHTIVAKSKTKELNNAYKRHCFQSQDIKRQFCFYAVGTKVSGISKTNIAKILIPIPPLPEQKEIARILSVWDAAIRDTTQLIAAKTRRKRALMQQLLTGKKQFQEYASTCFVEREIGDVLQETSRLVEWDDEQVYRLASIRRNSAGLFWREALRGDQIKVKKLHTIQQGDFLISHIQAAYGAMGCVPAEFEGGHVSDMYSILTPKPSAALDIRFMDYLSQMPKMHHQILQSSNGFFAERLRLNFDPREFLKQIITIPETVAEQRKICDVLDTAMREIQLLQDQLAAFKQQKRGLMQKLLTGETRVQVLAAPQVLAEEVV